MNRKRLPTLLVAILLPAGLLLGLLALGGPAPAHSLPATGPHLGYGFNVADWDVALVQQLGFDWIKVFSAPSSRLPLNVLLRLEANAGSLADLDAFGDAVAAIAGSSAATVEAYEIGNEPNLDASYGWGAPPVAADYATLLCRAYQRIKQADPTSLVISAGLAPTGRVSGTWNGHQGHNGLYQDERAFLQEFLDAGGGDCLDGLGYHPYGFSADFDAPPDVNGGQPASNCTNGFCFRGSEKIYQIMQANGLGERPLWATEFGWIVNPPEDCLDEPGWEGRIWQLVSEEAQAANLAGAFAYADSAMPWMGPMFVFNLNFNSAAAYPECEQMRFYSVAGRPAEAALGALEKHPAQFGAQLFLPQAGLTFLQAVAEQPVTDTAWLLLENRGWMPLTYTLAAEPGAALLPAFAAPSGVIAPGGWLSSALTLPAQVRPAGLYTGSVLVSHSAGLPAEVPVTLHVLPALHRLYLARLAR